MKGDKHSEELSPAPLEDRINSRWRDPEIALLIGLVYILSVWILPQLWERMGIPQLPTPDYLAESGTVHALSLALGGLPATAFLFLYLRFAEAEFMKLQLLGEREVVVGAVFLSSLLLFFLLDKFGVWPFTWRTIGNTSLDYARVLVRTNALIGIGILALSGIAITPILEETIFRFGVIQWTLQRTNSWVLSVVFSALVFAGAHAMAFSQHSLRLAVETFAFSTFTGWCVFKRKGRVGIPLALHAAKNTAELVSLIAAARVHA